jgi:hypothetical protein
VEREPGLRDLPAILRIAKKKYQERESDYLDRISISVLRRHELPITRRNASQYNLGGATAAVCIILPMMLFFSCSPQQFAHQVLCSRLLEAAAPLLFYLLLCMLYNLAVFSR